MELLHLFIQNIFESGNPEQNKTTVKKDQVVTD